MNCIFKRESQTINTKRHRVSAQHNFGKDLLNGNVLKWHTEVFLFYLNLMISAHRLAHSCWRQKLMVSYQHLLRPKTSLLSFGLKEDGWSCCLRLCDRLPDSQSKHWTPERSQCLSPLGPCEDIFSHKY